MANQDRVFVNKLRDSLVSFKSRSLISHHDHTSKGNWYWWIFTCRIRELKLNLHSGIRISNTELGDNVKTLWNAVTVHALCTFDIPRHSKARFFWQWGLPYVAWNMVTSRKTNGPVSGIISVLQRDLSICSVEMLDNTDLERNHIAPLYMETTSYCMPMDMFLPESTCNAIEGEAIILYFKNKLRSILHAYRAL